MRISQSHRLQQRASVNAGVDTHAAQGVLLYENLVHGKRKVRSRAMGQLYEKLKASIGYKDSWNILNAGIGGGWFTKILLEHILRDDAGGPSEVKLVGVDTSRPMLRHLLRSISDIDDGAVDINPEKATQAFKESEEDGKSLRREIKFAVTEPGCKCRISVELVNRDFLEYGLDREGRKFDVCLIFFLFHHLGEAWREGVSRVIDLVREDEGQVVLSEMGGDHACWSSSFEDVYDIPHLLSNEQRNKYLKFVKECLSLLREEYGAERPSKDVSAADVEPVLEVLQEAGFRHDGQRPAISEKYDRQIKAETWLQAGGLREGFERSFSVFPALSESRKGELAGQLQDIAQELDFETDSQVTVKDRLNLHVLQQKTAMTDEIDFFSKLRTPARDEDQRFDHWEEDLGKLIKHDVVSSPEVLFLLHWDLIEEDWYRKVPVFLKKGGNQFRRLLLYYWLTGEFVGDFRMTNFLFREIPVNAKLITRADSGKNTSAELYGSRTIRLNIPISPGSGIIESRFKSNFMNINKGIHVDVEKRGDEEGFYLSNFDRANNANIQKATKNLSNKLPANVTGAGGIFSRGSTEYANLKKNLENVFKKLSAESKHPDWYKGVRDLEYRAFIEVSALNALVIAESDDIEETRHYPSTDSLEPVEDGGKTPSYRELATGGVIVHCSEDTVVDDQRLRMLLNLRNRASSIEQHKRRATIKEREQARRSAVSTVMARNMSHNFGSHVLARLASPTNLRDHYDAEKEKGQHDPLKPVSLLNSYLRTRMDFLADVATGAPAVAMSKRLYRDTCAYLDNDEGIDRQEILLDKVSGTNLGVDSITLKIRSDNQEITTKTLEKDPLVAFPSDMLGAHAFYIILENIIRNCAKHSNLREDDDLEITVEVDEDLNHKEYYRVRIFDDIRKEEGLQDIVDDLNEGIDESILTDGELRQGYWGVLEMKIAAAYLRQIDPSQIDTEHDPRLLKALSREENTGLGYELYLKRHRLALVLDFDENQPLCERGSDDLRKRGVEVAEGRTRLEKVSNEEHDFLVLVSPTVDDLECVARNAKALPQKVIVCDSQSGTPIYGEDCYAQVEREEIESKLRSGNAMEVACWLWETWAENIFEDQPLPTLKKGPTDDPITICEGEDTHTFLFDHHGHFYDDYPAECQEANYYEPYGSTTPVGMILNNTFDWGELKKRKLCAELRTSSAFEVAVVDERVQEAATSQKDDEVDEYVDMVLEAMGVYIPQPSSEERETSFGKRTSNEEIVDLNRKNFCEKTKESIETWIGVKLSSGVECLVIHLGIIEKIAGTKKDYINEWVDKIETKYGIKKDCKKSIVVTSGRGTPSNLPDDARFLNYSLVARYLFEKRSKYHLYKLLSAARKQPSEQV